MTALLPGERLQRISERQNLIINDAGDILGIQSLTDDGADFRGGSGTVVNDLTTGGATVALSADQGVVLKSLIDAGTGGGGTDTGIDGGGPGAVYGGSVTIDGGGPGATYG